MEEKRQARYYGVMHNRPQTISRAFYCHCYGGVAPRASLNSKLNGFQNPTLIRIFRFICIVPFSRPVIVFALTTVTQIRARINTVHNITRSYGAVILFSLCDGRRPVTPRHQYVGVTNYRLYNGTRASPSAWPAGIQFSTGEIARQHLIGVRNTRYRARGVQDYVHQVIRGGYE